jgi:serine phosphatase RsbU (regulator of sigma subunit)
MRFSLRAFLFASLSVVTLAPIAYLGPSQVARWRAVQRENADRELRMAAESLARTVGLAIDGSVRDLTSTANQIGIHGDLDPAHLTSVLRQFRRAFPLCLGINVANEQGQPIATDPEISSKTNYRDRAYYQEMLRTRRTSVSDVEVGRLTGVPSIHMAAPIWSSQDAPLTVLRGAVINSIGLDHLQELTSRSVSMFGDMEARVLDRRSHLVVDSRRGSLRPLADLSGRDLYDLVAEGPAVLRTGTDVDGDHVRAAAAPVVELGWTVLVLRPVAAIEEGASRARVSTLVAFGAALFLGVIFSYLLSTWLARPVSRLSAYASQVARGQGVSPPAAAAIDAREVADLIGSVGTMVARLREQTDIIRDQEAERMTLAQVKRELEIAERIQTGILPKDLCAAGFEIAGAMQPAATVGGDYYELLQARSGFWLAVGDVSGHGLNAGLVMLMLQSAVAAVAFHAEDASPSRILAATNRMLVENTRRRLRGDDHVTVALAHLGHDGALTFAGGHEPLIILRQGAPRCEVHEVEGPWLGIKVDVQRHLEERGEQLHPGDLLVLHSDGIVEAGASRDDLFGLGRLCAAIERLRALPAAAMCRQILAEARDWAGGPQEDDMTVVIVRRGDDAAQGPSRGK